MVRRYSERSWTVVITSIAVLLILLLSSNRQAVREGYAVASPPPAPSWLLPGDYVEYNQTYTIGGLTASINVNDTVIGVNGAADMRIQRLGPQVPSGFSEPGLVTPYDSANESQQTTVVTTFANGSRSTSVESGSTFTTDLTMFVDQHLLTGTNATLVPLHVSGSGTPTVQAWKVDENVLYGFLGRPPEPPSFPVNPSLVWFEKDTLMKVRESTNYTDPNGNHIASVETIEDTNIPQLKSALTSQQSYSYSSLSSSTSATASLSTSTSATAQSPGDNFEAAGVVAVVVVTVTAMASYFLRANHRPSLRADPDRTQT